MGTSIGSRLQHAWNAFLNKDPTDGLKTEYMEPTYFYRPDRTRFTRNSERSIVTSIYNRIAIDVAAIQITHARLDDESRFLESIDSGINKCLTLEANLDQTGRAFIQDVVMSLLDEGCVAIVPVDTTINPNVTGSYDITNMRVGRITEWKPSYVKVEIYNEKTGKKEEVWLDKKIVAIVENPLYSIMNSPNSTLKRLVRKLNLLDNIDEQKASNKLNLILQLPYSIRSKLKEEHAEKRIKSIDDQLTHSPHGIAYTDGTEKVIQLNRPLENDLQSQIEYLTEMLYGQLGITKEVMDGTADEKTMLNYYNRTIEPILSSIVDEMKRKFLTQTARTQHQSIVFFRDPFRLVPVNELAEIADKFTRNEILTSNEFRQIIGRKPSKDPSADELRNSNLNRDRNEIPKVEKIQNEEKDKEDTNQDVKSQV